MTNSPRIDNLLKLIQWHQCQEEKYRKRVAQLESAVDREATRANIAEGKLQEAEARVIKYERYATICENEGAVNANKIEAIQEVLLDGNLYNNERYEKIHTIVYGESDE